MSSAEKLIKAYRELASLPKSDGKPFGDLALLAIVWPYAIVTGDGKIIPEDLVEIVKVPPPRELVQGRHMAVITARTYIAPLLDALGEKYIEVSRSPPSLLWYPSEKYEQHVIKFAECAEAVMSGDECNDVDYAILAMISVKIMEAEVKRAKKLRSSSA